MALCLSELNCEIGAQYLFAGIVHEGVPKFCSLREGHGWWLALVGIAECRSHSSVMPSSATPCIWHGKQLHFSSNSRECMLLACRFQCFRFPGICFGPRLCMQGMHHCMAGVLAFGSRPQ